MKSILLIGLGRFGMHVAKELHALGHQVMAVDENEERVNEVLPYVTNAQIGNSTNEEFLASLGIPDFDVCIVAIGNDFQSSLETTCSLKEMGAPLVVARAERDGQAKFLLRNGADDVVYPEKQLAKWTAIRYSSDHILDYVALDDEHAMYEVDMPTEWIGKTVGQMDIRKKYHINIMAVKRSGNKHDYGEDDAERYADLQRTAEAVGDRPDRGRARHTPHITGKRKQREQRGTSFRQGGRRKRKSPRPHGGNRKADHAAPYKPQPRRRRGRKSAKRITGHTTRRGYHKRIFEVHFSTARCKEHAGEPHTYRKQTGT